MGIIKHKWNEPKINGQSFINASLNGIYGYVILVQLDTLTNISLVGGMMESLKKRKGLIAKDFNTEFCLSYGGTI